LTRAAGLATIRRHMATRVHPRRAGRRLGRWLGPAALLWAGVLAAAPTATFAAAPIAWPVQSLGDRGTDVLAIQHLLRARLPVVSPVRPPTDARFEASTVAAVRAFQLGVGLPVNGIVDTATWSRLARTVQLGSRGSAVIALQVELRAKVHAGLTVSGRFDGATRLAVAAFQRHMGLPATGAVDQRTWRALAWHFETPAFGSSTGLCDYTLENGKANWATAEAIDTLEAVGRAVQALGYGRIALGDASLEHGGDIAGHQTHERGLDLDIRPLRVKNDQCTWGTNWRLSSYDRAATRAMIRQFRALAPGHIKVIYFNDPVLIREGLTTWFTGHDDHLHVRFCEARHALVAYDC
jgi:peptidoglycan hydrolase-like protein with peptidoglycan-binding domain